MDCDYLLQELKRLRIAHKIMRNFESTGEDVNHERYIRSSRIIHKTTYRVRHLSYNGPKNDRLDRCNNSSYRGSWGFHGFHVDKETVLDGTMIGQRRGRIYKEEPWQYFVQG